METEDLFRRIDQKLAQSEFKDLATSVARQYVAETKAQQVNATQTDSDELDPKIGVIADEHLEDTDEDDSVSDFSWIQSLRKTPTFSPEEHVELAKAIEAGVLAQGALEGLFPKDSSWRDSDLAEISRLGRIARDRMVAANLGLVLYWAQKARRQWNYSLEDRFQDGCGGLLRALEGWDWQRGYTFSTYATWHIRQQISRRMNDSAYTIRIPIHVQEDWAAAARSSSALDDLAQFAWDLITTMVPWEEVVEVGYEEEDEDQHQEITEIVENLANSQVLHQCLARLNEDQRHTLKARFGLSGREAMTLDEIGQERGVTRERIRQVEKRALERAHVYFWTLQTWFVEGVVSHFETMDMGPTLAALVCADPFAPYGQMARAFDLPSAHIRQIQEFVREIALEASRHLDPFGEPSRATWSRLMRLYRFSHPEVIGS